jgi:hypothetical protein
MENQKYHEARIHPTRGYESAESAPEPAIRKKGMTLPLSGSGFRGIIVRVFGGMFDSEAAAAWAATCEPWFLSWPNGSVFQHHV